MGTKKQLRKMVIVLGCLALVCAGLFVVRGTPQQQYNSNIYRAEQYLNDQDYSSAVKAYEAAAAIDPDRSAAYIGLGAVYRQQAAEEEDTEQKVSSLNSALDSYQTLVSEAIDSTAGHVLEGQTYEEIGDTLYATDVTAALDSYQKAAAMYREGTKSADTDKTTATVKKSAVSDTGSTVVLTAETITKLEKKAAAKADAVAKGETPEGVSTDETQNSGDSGSVSSSSGQTSDSAENGSSGQTAADSGSESVGNTDVSGQSSVSSSADETENVREISIRTEEFTPDGAENSSIFPVLTLSGEDGDEDALREALDDFADSARADISGKVSEEGAGYSQRTLYVRVARNDDKILSVEEIAEVTRQDEDGGTEQKLVVFGYTWDAETGERLTLDDVAADSEAVLETAADLREKAEAAEDSSDEEDAERAGTEEDLQETDEEKETDSRDEMWYLDDQGLVLAEETDAEDAADLNTCQEICISYDRDDLLESAYVPVSEGDEETESDAALTYEEGSEETILFYQDGNPEKEAVGSCTVQIPTFHGTGEDVEVLNARMRSVKNHAICAELFRIAGIRTGEAWIDEALQPADSEDSTEGAETSRFCVTSEVISDDGDTADFQVKLSEKSVGGEDTAETDETATDDGDQTAEREIRTWNFSVDLKEGTVLTSEANE